MEEMRMLFKQRQGSRGLRRDTPLQSAHVPGTALEKLRALQQTILSLQRARPKLTPDFGERIHRAPSKLKG